MRKTYTSPAVKARWNRRHYDRITMLVPKGEKEQVMAFAQSQGLSLNGYINRLVRTILSVEEADWKPLYVDPIE